MAEIYRVLAGLQAQSGLPEDRFMNTWHFSVAGADSAGARADAILAVDAFYAELASHYPSSMTELDYRLYMLSDVEPREPDIYTPGWAASAGVGGLPWEVACCMSYFHDRNIPRQRGRLYIGPLTTADVATTEGTPGVSTILRQSILDGAQAIWTFLDGQADGVEWGVYSPTSGMIHTIDTVWVDNAFDTQRRRGNEATSRMTLLRNP